MNRRERKVSDGPGLEPKEKGGGRGMLVEIRESPLHLALAPGETGFLRKQADKVPAGSSVFTSKRSWWCFGR